MSSATDSANAAVGVAMGMDARVGGVGPLRQRPRRRSSRKGYTYSLVIHNLADGECYEHSKKYSFSATVDDTVTATVRSVGDGVRCHEHSVQCHSGTVSWMMRTFMRI